MSAVIDTPVRSPEPVAPAPLAATPEAIEQTQPFSTHELHRWALLLIVPFILGAAFFALAIGLDAEWPMAPAFLLGPLVLISAYIFLSLSSEANSISG